MPTIHTSAATNVGLVRENNEDTFLEDPQQGLWIVADGMGGHEAGEVASSIVTQVISEKIADGANLSEAIQASHESIIKAGQAGVGAIGMGSTVVALSSQGKNSKIAWIGDSRAYLWNANQSPRLNQLSTDHSYVQMLFEAGLIEAQDITFHPDKNVITQCLGSTEVNEMDVGIVEFKWQRGDRLLLCSDGLTDIVSDTEIEFIISSSATIEIATESLIKAALKAGGKDNVTVLLAEPSDQITRSPLGRLFSRS